MLRRLALTAALLAAVPLAGAGASPVDGAQRVVEQAAADSAAQCRQVGAPDPTCAQVPLSPPVTAQALEDYQRSATHRALQLQSALGDSLPLRNASWVGTHNSFNTSAASPTLSALDANQQLTMTQQLDSDVRSLELDAHWFPSARTGRMAPVLCHGESEDQAHAGCTTERLLAGGLAEIDAWLARHPREVVLLYLEDHLVGDLGFTTAAQALKAELGPRLYSAGGTGCTALPLDLTRDQVRAAGKQVVVMSTCHSGAGWNGLVYDDKAREKNETGPGGYGVGGTCDPAKPPAAYDDQLLRVYEDSTAVSALTGGAPERLDTGKVRALQRCAVDLTGFDQLLPNDPRLAGLVWTWAQGQPSSGACVYQGSDGRWRTGGCGGKALACKGSEGWFIGHKKCRGGAWSAPRYGYDGVLLTAAMARARVATVLLPVQPQR